MLEATIVFSCAAFIGNFGVALTGFGMAIFFLFVYNIGEFAGVMDSEGCDRCGIKDAVFYQTIALFAAIPVLLFRAREVIREYRNKTLLMTFIPATIIGTPVGNFLQEHLPAAIVRLILGIAITFALVNTMYRQIIQMDCYKRRVSKDSPQEEENKKSGNDSNMEVKEIKPNEAKEISPNGDAAGENINENVDAEEGIVQEETDEKGEDAQKSEDEVDAEMLAGTLLSEVGGENTNENVDTEKGIVQEEADEKGEDAQKSEDEVDAEMLAGTPLKIWGSISGFLSGFLGGLMGVRGPPLMIFFLYFSFPKNVVRANSILILLVNVTIRVVYYIIEDASGRRTLPWFERDLWYLYLSLVISAVLGVPIGQYVASLVSQNQFKLIIAFMLLMSGVSNMIKGGIDIARGS